MEWLMVMLFVFVQKFTTYIGERRNAERWNEYLERYPSEKHLFEDIKS